MTLCLARGGAIAGALLVLVGPVPPIKPVTGVKPLGTQLALLHPRPRHPAFRGDARWGRSTAPFAVPADILTTLGLILFYQNAVGHFQGWGHAWASITPGAVGADLFLLGYRGGHATVRQVGAILPYRSAPW